MKTLNVRLVAILLVCGLVFGVAVYFLHAFQIRRNAYVFLRMADEARQRAKLAEEKNDTEKTVEEYRTAIQNLGWYVKLAPNDIDALAELGWLWADLAQRSRDGRMFGQAIVVLEEVLRHDPTRSDARRKLIEIYMMRGIERFSDAKEHIENVSKESREDGEMLEMLGRCQAEDAEDSNAMESFQAAIKSSPHRIGAYGRLAGVLLRREGLNLPTKADECIKQMIEANPDSPQAHLLFSRYLANLLTIDTLEEARKHPILLETIIPVVMSETIKYAISDLKLPADDPDAVKLAEKHQVLADALQRAIKSYDADSKLDDPAALLLSARTPIGIDELDLPALTEAINQTVEALEPELQPGDREALLAAVEHGVMENAMKAALQAMSSRRMLLHAARQGIVTGTQKHAITARELTSRDREMLSKASESGAVVAAMKHALGKNGDRVALRLTANRDTLSAAAEQAVKSLQLTDGDGEAMLRAAKGGVLVHAMVLALKDHRVVSGDRDASLQAEDGVLSQAVKDAINVLEEYLASNDGEALMLLAKCAIQERQYDEARQYAEEGIKLYPGFVAMYSLLAGVEDRTKQPEKAIDWLKQGLKATKGNARLLWSLADILLDTGKIEEAQKTIEQLAGTEYTGNDALKIPPATVAAAYLRARAEFLQGHWLAASRDLESVRSGLFIWPRLLTEVDTSLARCYERLGNVDYQIAAWQRVLEANPLNGQARLELTNIYLGRGDPEKALKMYEPVFARRGASAGSWLARAKILIAMNRLQSDPALQNWEEVEKALDQAIVMAKEVLDEAKTTTGAAPDVTPDAEMVAAQRESEAARVLVDAPILRAQVLATQGRVEEAEKLLLEVSKDNPKEVKLWVALISRAQEAEDWDKVLKLVEQAQGLFGDTVALRLAGARYLVARFGEGAAGGLKELSKNVDQFSQIERLALWSGLLNLAFKVRDLQHAAQLCQQIAEGQPNNVQIRMLLFDLAMAANKVPQMEKVLAEIQEIEGEGPHWLFGQAVLLSFAAEDPDDERLEQALRFLRGARKLHRSWSRLPLLAGGIFDKQDKPGLALENYEQAIELGERNPRAIARCVRYYTANGRYAEANKMLSLLGDRQDVVSSGDVSRAKMGGGDLEGALEMARKAATGSSNYDDHLYLAQVLGYAAMRAYENRKPVQYKEMMVEAGSALRRAVSLADTLSGPRVALIRYLVQTEQREEAEKVLEEVRNKFPVTKDPLALAGCYEAMNREDEAQKAYTAALAAAPDDLKIVQAVVEFYVRTDQIEPAKEQLKKIVDGKLKADDNTVKAARRRLAVLLVATRDYQDWTQARQLIEKNLESGASSRDQSLMAMILKSDPSGESDAKRFLEELKNKSPNEKFSLAQIYQRQGEWAKAKALMIEVLTTHGDTPQYVAAYVNWLVRKDEIETAGPWMRKLETLLPNSFGTVHLRAKLLFSRGKLNEAFELVENFVGRRGAQPSEEVQQLRRVAPALEDFARQLTQPDQQDLANQLLARVDSIYRRLVSKNPGYALPQADFLIRQGRIDEALQSAESSLPTANVYWLAQICEALLTSPDASQQQLARGERILQAALDKYKDDDTLLLVVAAVRSHQGRYQDAEAAYRTILEQDDKNAVAMNNLAVLLALQKVKIDEALSLIQKAISISGPVATMLDSRATVHMALGPSDRALVDLEKALIEGATPVRLFHQAQAFEKLGKRKAAAEALKKANDLGLTPEMLHPLESGTYAKLQELLKK